MRNAYRILVGKREENKPVGDLDLGGRLVINRFYRNRVNASVRLQKYVNLCLRVILRRTLLRDLNTLPDGHTLSSIRFG
jgi:hypothetical protein